MRPSLKELTHFLVNQVSDLFIIQMQKDGLIYVHPIAIGETQALHGNTTVVETDEQASALVHHLISESGAERAIIGVLHHRKNKFKFMRLKKSFEDGNEVCWAGGSGEKSMDQIREDLGTITNEDLVNMLNNRTPNDAMTYEELLEGAIKLMEETSEETIKGPPIGGIN